MLSRKGYIIATVIIFFIIIAANLKFGYALIGNDNFSPELAPSTTLDRSIFGPGWREYRALGVPSDSEQADIVRTALFTLAAGIKLPSWILSNLYYFSTVLIAFVSAGKVVSYFALKVNKKDEHSVYYYWIELLGGLFYIGSLLAIWIYFFPVHLFVAAFAFLPLVTWRLIEYAEDRSPLNLLILVLSGLMLSTAALTATVFFVVYGALIGILSTTYIASKKLRKGIVVGLIYIFLLQLYWFLPFSLYVRSNTSALQNSLINRKITALQIQNEEKYNTLSNTPRYAFSWLDDKIDDEHYAYLDRSWFKENIVGKLLTFIIPIFALVGIVALLRGKTKWGWVLILQVLGGVFLIKGTNSPFGFLYGFIEHSSSIFAQVFRWRSSKFWPFLALSLPILAGIGVVFMQHAYSKATRTHKNPAIFILTLAAIILLMKPYLTGGMIRPSMYVQVPSDYYALREYLTQKDPHGRIYVVPEANTLYFRNYDWGFFGSVMLNYILPNPTFEKALVIGSKESESAADIIKNAYYSRNKAVFVRALDQFGVSYILTDNHATQGIAGYPYDLSLVNDMTADNIFLQKEWEQGALTLYTVNTGNTDHVFEKINPQHDISKLALYEILQDTNFTYLSQSHDQGQASLYPFALNYKDSNFNKTNNTVTFSSPLTLHGDYGATLVQSDFLEVPTHISSKDPLFITLSSAFPRIRFNESELAIDTPFVTFQKNPEYTLNSVGNRVVESDSMFLDTTYGHAIDNPILRGWKISRIDEFTNPTSSVKLFCNNEALLTDITVDGKALCGTDKVTVDKDTILIIDTKLNNTMNPIQGALCVKSHQKDTCLNIQRHITIDKQASLHLVVPEIVHAGDTYEIFFEFDEINPNAPENAHLGIEKFTVDSYDQNIELTKVSEKLAPQNQTFTIHVDGDVLFSMELPLIESESTLVETGKEPTTLKSSFEPYASNESNMTMSINDSGIAVEHKESAFSRFADIPFNSRENLAMVLVKGKNSQGIPADIKIKNPKQGASVYENKLLLNKESMFYDFIVIPEGNPHMNVEVFSTALGPVSSINQLEELIVQNIPKPWLQLKLVPSTPNTYQPLITAKPALPNKESNIYIANVPKDSIMALPTAISPYWSIRKIANSTRSEELLSRGSSIFSLIGAYTDFLFAGSNSAQKQPAQKITINQWQQGFVVAEDGVYEVIFWPNLLIYLGYILNISILISLVYGVIKTVKQAR